MTVRVIVGAWRFSVCGQHTMLHYAELPRLTYVNVRHHEMLGDQPCFELVKLSGPLNLFIDDSFFAPELTVRKIPF